MRQRVVSVVPAGGSLFEIATPTGVWGAGRTRVAGLEVDFIACGMDGDTVTLSDGMTMSGLVPIDTALAGADIVVIPTWPIETHPVPDALAERLREASQAGSRLVGLCLGAFAVAATGLLDGSTAVTHWRHRERFEALHPEIRFEPDTLYVDHGSIVTSAGSAAAMDCCLHMVRRDHGAEPAALIARSLVTAPHRSGTQSQFAAAPPLPAGLDMLGEALGQAAADIAAVADVDALAQLTNLSRRTLERQLRDRLGVSPKEWIDEQRVLAACRLLEQPELSVEQVATMAGYGSAPSLRRALQHRRGTTPSNYRAMFSTRSDNSG